MAIEGFVTRAISFYVPWPVTTGTNFELRAIRDGANNIEKALKKTCGAQINHFDNVNCQGFRFQMQFFITSCKNANPKPHQAIVYICTHGILNETSNELHLMMDDSPNPNSDRTAFFENSIPGRELRGYVKELKKAMPDGKVLVLLDCSNAGALIEALGFSETGLAYFGSCQRSEESLIVLDGARRGPHFTNAVANVLMEAPKGEVIDLTKLVSRVKSEVEASSGGLQHPVEFPRYWSEQGLLYGMVGLGDGEHEVMEGSQRGLFAAGTVQSRRVRTSYPGDPASSPAEESSAPLTEQELLDIADEIGGIWRAVGKRLLLKEGALDSIDGTLSLSKPPQKAFKMLITWREGQEYPSRSTLADALEKGGKVGLAREVRDYRQQNPSPNPPQHGRLPTGLHKEEAPLTDEDVTLIVCFIRTYWEAFYWRPLGLGSLFEEYSSRSTLADALEKEEMVGLAHKVGDYQQNPSPNPPQHRIIRIGPHKEEVADALERHGKYTLAGEFRAFQQNSSPNSPQHGRLQIELDEEEGHQAATPREKPTSQQEAGSRAKEAEAGHQAAAPREKPTSQPEAGSRAEEAEAGQ